MIWHDAIMFMFQLSCISEKFKLHKNLRHPLDNRKQRPPSNDPNMDRLLICEYSIYILLNSKKPKTLFIGVN